MNFLIKFCSNVIKHMQKVIDFDYWNKLFTMFAVVSMVFTILLLKVPRVVSEQVPAQQQIDPTWIQIIATVVVSFLFQLLSCLITFAALLLMIANATHYPKRSRLYHLKLLMNMPVILVFALMFIDDFGSVVRLIIDIPADIFSGVFYYLLNITNGFLASGAMLVASLFNLFYLNGFGYKYSPPRK